MKKFALITGATSGLGLALVKELLQNSDIHFVLPVRNSHREQELHKSLVREWMDRLTLVQMDLSNLASVRASAGALETPIDIAMFNAGVQSAERTIYTADGLEQSFGVNHLAHFVLLRTIEHLLSPKAVIGWVGSGTHHPDLAKKFGFTGAHYSDPMSLIKGAFNSKPDTRQSNRDAYATSKGLNILMARHFALMDSLHTYFSFDPGLMPGTGLAREGTMGLKIAWKYALPIAAKFMKGTSTPAQSAALLARILLQTHNVSSGDYIEFTGDVLRPYMPISEDTYAKQLFDFSDGFV